LTRLWAAGVTDERVFQTIRQGVPNTIMPSSSAPDDELRSLVIYLRSLNGSGTTEASTGNAQNGERIFWASCGGCHVVNGRGGPLGPDLSQIAQSQSRELLTRAVRDPNASIPDGYKPVAIVTRDGQRIRGVRKSEDAFSIQLMDEGGRLRGYLKSGVRDVVSETNSLMPAFGPDRLNDSDLTDVLAFLGRK
jgi:putative heme-binding domain-containing protein